MHAHKGQVEGQQILGRLLGFDDGLLGSLLAFQGGHGSPQETIPTSSFP
jgi:hypothetical protein